jgi:hypothetical protein
VNHVSDCKTIIILGIIWLLLFAPCSSGQVPAAPAQLPLPPGIEIKATAQTATALVGDPVQIDMEIKFPTGCKIEIPKPANELGDFSLLDFIPGPIVPVPAQEKTKTGSTSIHRARITVAIYKTGSFTFPPINISIKTPEGKAITVSSPPVQVEIKSVLTEKQPNLKDLKKQAEIPETIRWLLWIALALAALATGWLIWFLLRRRRRGQPPAAAVQPQDLLAVAAADLRNLLARGIPEGAAVKPFYVLLSEIIKRIIELGYDVPTAEQTTEEIIESLRQKPVPNPEAKETIVSFLIHCDLVKFAKYFPSRMEHEVTFKNAQAILQSTVSSRQ